MTYERGYTLLIGKFYGTRDLGLYGRADAIQQYPAGLISGIISRVTFPLFSVAKHDKARLRRGIQLPVRGTMLINTPAMFGLFAVAEPLLSTLLGVRWLPAVPVLRVLCLGGVVWPLHVLNLDVLSAQGHSHLFFRLEVIKRVVGGVFLIAGSFYGVMGLAWAQAIFGILAFVINAHYTAKTLDYGPLAQLRDIGPIIVIALPMAISVFWLGSVWPGASASKLIVMIALGVGVFLFLAYAVKLTAMHEVLKVFKHSL